MFLSDLSGNLIYISKESTRRIRALEPVSENISAFLIRTTMLKIMNQLSVFVFFNAYKKRRKFFEKVFRY